MKTNQNTHEVKNERFLISTQQNNGWYTEWNKGCVRWRNMGRLCILVVAVIFLQLCPHSIPPTPLQQNWGSGLYSLNLSDSSWMKLYTIPPQDIHEIMMAEVDECYSYPSPGLSPISCESNSWFLTPSQPWQLYQGPVRVRQLTSNIAGLLKVNTQALFTATAYGNPPPSLSFLRHQE